MIRTSISLLAALAVFPAFAADVTATSAVTAATVYPQGALVSRKVTFSVAAGDNRVIVSDLPMNFDAASLRVTGEGTGEFTILSVDHRIDRLPPAPDAENPARDALEAEIEALETRIRGIEKANDLLQADIDGEEARLKFADTLIKREPQRMVDEVDATRADPATWITVIGLLADETGKAKRAIVEAEAKIDDNSRLIDELYQEISEKQQAIAALELPPTDKSIATIELASDQPIEGELTISYQVWNAGWQPVYDLRLDQGEAAKLSIERQARVSQTTGEDWTDVALTLSTARPSGRVDAPELYPMGAYIYDPNVAYPQEEAAGAAYDSVASPLAEPAPMVMNEAQAELIGGLEREARATTASALVDLQGQTVVFRIAGPADVSGDGTVRQLGVDQAEFDVKLLARSAPEFDTNAYLYATLVNGFSGPLLPGRTSIFRDGTFVGQGSLPLIPAGKEVVLPFGVLDGITVKRSVLERTTGDFGVIGTTNQRIERFELSAESVLTYAIPLTIYERIPYSENEDLEVLPSSSIEPSVVDVDGKRGVRNWTFVLEPGATKVIETGWELRWPGGMEMQLQP